MTNRGPADYPRKPRPKKKPVVPPPAPVPVVDMPVTLVAPPPPVKIEPPPLPPAPVQEQEVDTSDTGEFDIEELFKDPAPTPAAPAKQVPAAPVGAKYRG